MFWDGGAVVMSRFRCQAVGTISRNAAQSRAMDQGSAAGNGDFKASKSSTNILRSFNFVPD
jgi:hypothetical protein